MHQAASSIILPILLARPVICNAAICAQSIIPVIADSCGQSRTEPGLREKGKTHTQRAKLPKIRGSGTEPGNSIRTIADSRHLGTTPLHFQPAHTPPLTISSSPDSPMTRFPLLRSDQTLFRHPDAFEPAFVPDHLHHRDAQTQELARASSGPPSGAGALSPRLPGDREDHHRPPDLFRGHEETQSTSTAGIPPPRTDRCLPPSITPSVERASGRSPALMAKKGIIAATRAGSCPPGRSRGRRTPHRSTHPGPPRSARRRPPATCTRTAAGPRPAPAPGTPCARQRPPPHPRWQAPLPGPGRAPAGRPATLPAGSRAP
jgi:hypothetical protein